MTKPRTKTPSDGQKLLARGTTVMLGGSPVTVRADWEAVEALELEWGSMRAWAAELKKGGHGGFFRAVGSGITACVRDLPVAPRSLMDLSLVAEYAEALNAAFKEAGLWKEDEEGNPPGPTTAPSPGNGSSTSTSSTGDSAPPSSGA